MAEFEIYSEENHPEKSADVIAKANKAYGFVPNLLGALSEAPAVAQAYMDLASAVGNSSLTLEERHVAWFTINTYHGCDYCMAAHTATAKRQKVADDVIASEDESGEDQESVNKENQEVDIPSQDEGQDTAEDEDTTADEGENEDTAADENEDE